VRKSYRKPRAFAAISLAVGLLAACAEVSPPNPLPELTFAQLDKIQLNVASVEIVESYIPPLRRPNIEQFFPVSPSQVARLWSEGRLAALGTEGRALFIIDTASVVETLLPVEKGLRGAVTVDQASRYDATLVVTLEIRNNRGFRLAFATARAERSLTVAEDLTLNERNMIQFRLVEDLMNDLNVALETKVAEFLSAYTL
jgi:hypothetical protein